MKSTAKAKEETPMRRIRETETAQARAGAGAVPYTVENVRVIEIPADAPLPEGAEEVPETTRLHDWKAK